MFTPDKCSYCGRYGPVDAGLDELLSKHDESTYRNYNDYPYEWWANIAQVDTTYFVDGVGEVKLVSKDAERPEDYGTQECHLVFEIDGVFYKKEGEVSSYDGYRWEGGLKVVEAKTRPVVYYE
jgi:hypothetical protein